jgi:hypothetical protein
VIKIYCLTRINAKLPLFSASMALNRQGYEFLTIQQGFIALPGRGNGMVLARIGFIVYFCALFN